MIRRALLLNFRLLHRVDRWVQRRFTQAGMVVLGAMVASGVFGIDTGSTMASQIFTTSVALISLALLCSLRLKTRLDTRRDVPKYATVGEPVTYRIILTNQGDRRLSGVWVEEQVKERIPAQREFMRASEPGRQQRNLFDRHVGYPRWAWLVKRGRGAVTHECEAPSIPARGSVSVDVSLTPIRRGYVRLTGVDILRREPFGLCKARQLIGETQSILVLPKRYPVRWRADVGARLSMTGRSNAERTMGGSEDFSTVREYRARDPLRQIHWPSSARLGQLIVKEFHQQSDSRICLVLDTFSADSSDQQLEEAVSIAASFAHNPTAAQRAVDTLFTVDEIVRSRPGSGAVTMLETLACIEGCTDQTFDVLRDAVENHAGVINSAVCVLLEWDEVRQGMIRALQDRDVPVFVIVVTRPGDQSTLEPGAMSGCPAQFQIIPAGDAKRCLLTLGTYASHAPQLFWGWHVDLLPYALVMSLIVESTRWVPWRWQVAEKDFNRVTDFTSVGFVLVIIYQFDTHSFHAIYAILELLPMVLFVLLAVQIYSTEEGVRLTTLFLSVRRAVARGHVIENRTIDLSYSYVVVCLIAASAGEVRSPWFIAGVLVITAYALFWHRPRGRSVVVWGCLLMLVAAGGFFGHKAVLKIRWMLEPAFVAWFQDAHWANRSPFRGHTAIGAIGNLKLSERIVLRVKPGGDGSYPTLLRDAVYQTFNRNTWISRTNTFKDLEPISEGTVWPLHPGAGSVKQVDISSYLKRGKGLITVPSGAFRIERLGVEDLGLSPLGVLQTKRGPGLINYVVRYNPGTSHEEAPQSHDLYVPSYYEELFDELTRELGLTGLAPPRVLSSVQGFFTQKFRCSLELHGGQTTPLRHFLTKSRVGHCEYFATSTVMLLRALGIPARYATGYSVQEWSPLEKSFVVRRRHAHSWTLAYVDGRWVDVDTTPAVWAELEADEAPWWTPLYDLWSWSGYQFSRWRWSETGDEETNPVLVWLILPLAIILVWRLSRQNRVRLGRLPAIPPVFKQGEDSAFYQIEKQLSAAGFERGTGETIQQWLIRWSHARQLPGANELLDDIVPLHYRYRFDPAGLSSELSRTLRARIDRWLVQHSPHKI